MSDELLAERPQADTVESEKLSELDDLLIETIDQATIGGEGGKAWGDPRTTLARGPITQIRLWYGSEIDKIQVFYGGYPAQPHGGSGASRFYDFHVNDGYDIVEIMGRCHERVDQLQFIARPRNGKGEVQVSEPIGGDGGDPFAVSSPAGLPLRSIRGRSGDRTDQLTFNFGRLYEIRNAVIDEQAIRDQLRADGKLRVLDTMTYRNDTDADLNPAATFRDEVKRSLTTRVSWESASRFLAGIEVKAAADVLIAKAETTMKFEFEQTFTYGKEEEEVRETTRSWEIPFPCPKRHVATAYVSAFTGEVTNIPFTYDVALLDSAGVNPTAIIKNLNGVFSGRVLSNEIDVSVKTAPISETSRKMLEDALGE